MWLIRTRLQPSAIPDPGAAQEAAPYKQDPEVLAMTNLVAAYQANDILGFEKILRTNRRGPPPMPTCAPAAARYVHGALQHPGLTHAAAAAGGSQTQA